MAAPVRIGTSGFAYRDWVGTFYPPDARSDELLALYSERLSSVELSATFHRLPALSTVAGWASMLDPNFRICLTAPRHLTADLRVSHAMRWVRALGELVDALGVRAGPVLLQIPPVVQADLPALENFLSALDGLRVALDLRHPTWHSDGCLRLLSRHGAALVVSDEGVGMPRAEVTSDFTYWRLRQVADEDEWRSWAERAAYTAARGVEVFCFLKQERGGQAALQAEQLAQQVQEILERLSPGEERPEPHPLHH